MKTKTALVKALILMTAALSLTACGTADTSQQSVAVSSAKVEADQESNIGKYEDYTLTLNDGTVATSDDGSKVIKVNATFQNDSSEGNYAYSGFAVKAFQNDEEIEAVSDINGDEASLIQEVKNGQTVDVTFVFKLTDDSDVEVLINEPTANETTVGKKIYKVAD